MSSEGPVPDFSKYDNEGNRNHTSNELPPKGKDENPSEIHESDDERESGSISSREYRNCSRRKHKRRRRSRSIASSSSSESSSGSDSDESRHRHRKKHKRKHRKRKHKRSSSTRSRGGGDSSSKSRRDRRKYEKKKKRRKKEKRKRDSKDSSDDSGSDSKSDNGEVKVRRSAISGKKIKMHIDKTEDDLVREKARKEMLKFMNSSL